MAQTTNWLYDVRAWVILPNIIKTDFEKGKGWDLEGKLIKKLPEWKWEDHGVTPVVQAVSLEDGEEALMLTALEPVVLTNGSSENSKVIEVKVTDPAETPYILLAFDESVSEEDIKQALIVTKKDETNRIDINWVGEDGQINSTYEINAGTDLIENVDGNKYRVVLLRLRSGGTYEVITDSLTLVTDKSKGVTVTPFEKLGLNLNSSSGVVSGKIKYAEDDTTYTLRTYLAEEEGGADYLIDEQIVKDTQNISVTVPTSGTHAPTGSYYVTSFLMTEKSVEVTENGASKTVNALAAIDSWQSDTTVDYTNSNQPAAPANVTLTFVGNEVMRAAWEEVSNADGYRVKVYQLDSKGKWQDTGFGYDLDKDTTSIDMALTVGGEETENSKNLSANETYMVGVSAYKEEPYFTESTETGSMEGEETGAAEGAEGSTAGSGGTSAPKALTAKYYSKETQSADDGVFLPEYKELKISLKVGDKECDKDNGVFHAYVGENPGTLTVICDDPDADFTVTRMDDTDYPVQLGTNREWGIPTFEGSLMLKIDGIVENNSATDVTSVFLLVSRDETPPVLTLSDPVFFADRDTGEYTITGTADAGSEILYGENGRTQAAGDGSFAIHDKLEDERETNASLYLRAKDSAGNESAPQLALITRQTRYAVTVNGSYADVSGAGSYAAGSVVTVRAGSRGGYTFNGWTADSSVAFDDANAAETTFTMPDGSVTVTANWSRDGGSPSSGRDDSDPRYAVGIPDKTENGSVSVSPKNASQGDRVTVTVKPDAGYELDSLKVFDKNGKELELTDKGDGKFTFIMPAGKVEVKAAFTEEVKISPFRDVPTDAYYYEAVKWAQKKGITGVIGDGLFGPNQPCTRAQIVTFLWRAAGSPEPEGTAAGMTDVAAGSYYEKAVAWAIENGITTGTADGRFAPDATCTRAQGMTFLFRASKASADGAPAFSDVAADAYYAEAVKWATDNGITNGTTSSTFSPGSGCTRAQIVTFLWRLYAEK